ncbi:MAG: hypothetical protein QOE58_1895 [Actinomycetota bacterium]|jgi:hypothetical protein|nr:hypothetical protein [Actinomycetota bacterium]
MRSTMQPTGGESGDDRTDVLPWQCKGRCLGCGTKVTGCRRVRTCGCGGRVTYR